MARATSSLPTPLSPRMSTVTSLSDTCSMTERDRLHLGAVAPEQEGAVLVVAQLAPQLGDFRDQACLLDGALDGGVERDLAEPLRVVRLDDVVGRAEAHGLDDGGGLLAARQHDHLQIGLGRFQRPQRLQAVHARHHHVEQDDVGRVALLDRRDHFVAPRVGTGVVAAQATGRSAGSWRSPSRRRRSRCTVSSTVYSGSRNAITMALRSPADLVRRSGSGTRCVQP